MELSKPEGFFMSFNFQKALKYLWILLIIYFAIDFTTSYFYPTEKSILSKFLAIIFDVLSCLFFSWYFIINKKWKSFAIVFPFLVLFYVFGNDIQKLADYYIPYEKFIDSHTLKSLVYSLAKLLVVYFFAKQLFLTENPEGKTSFFHNFRLFFVYLKDLFVQLLRFLSGIFLAQKMVYVEKDQSRFLFLKTFLLCFAFLSIYSSDIGFFEQMLNSASYSSKLLEFGVIFLYHAFVVLKNISYLGLFFYILQCVFNNQSLYNFSKDGLKYANSHFVLMTMVMISSFFFLLGDLVQSSISLEVDFFGDKLTFLGWTFVICNGIIFIVVARLLGQFIQMRSSLNGKFYGVVGSFIWFPILNIISWFMIKFDNKLKFLAPKNLKKAKHIHLIIFFLILLFVYRDNIFEFKKEGILNLLVISSAVYLVSYIKKYTWLFPFIFSMVFLLIKVYPFSGLYEKEFIFKEYIIDFTKHTFSVAMVLTTSLFYGIFYIIYSSMKSSDNKF